MAEPISWSQLYRHRRAAAARFGKIFELPLRKRVRDVLLEHVRDAATVLEIGAGDRSMGTFLLYRVPEISYQSMDIDPEGQHDYRTLESIAQSFDVIYALEVIEHLSLDEIRSWLRCIRGLLTERGAFVLSTPNTFYPPAYLRDATHRTPLCYDELAGLLTAAGFEVESVVRIYNDPVSRMILRRFLFGWLFRLIGIDFARQIVVVARRT
jgi:hypothetical protein